MLKNNFNVVLIHYFIIIINKKLNYYKYFKNFKKCLFYKVIF